MVKLPIVLASSVPYPRIVIPIQAIIAAKYGNAHSGNGKPADIKKELKNAELAAG